jgi:hypothetical protein
MKQESQTGDRIQNRKYGAIHKSYGHINHHRTISVVDEVLWAYMCVNITLNANLLGFVLLTEASIVK